MTQGMLRLANGAEVAFRRSGRARRIILRVDRLDGQAVLTLPHGASLADARRFADRQADWLAARQAAAPGRMQVAGGVEIPIGGQAKTVTPLAGIRAARSDSDRLLVPDTAAPGPAVAAFLRHRARENLLAACNRYQNALAGLALDRPPRRFSGLTLRDTRSRWGSCSSKGRLMFSWRLAMAPDQVLDYVAAHEVAHLAHMDHSPAFWAVVAALFPAHADSRRWLRQNGAALLSWQFTPG